MKQVGEVGGIKIFSNESVPEGSMELRQALPRKFFPNAYDYEVAEILKHSNMPICSKIGNFMAMKTVPKTSVYREMAMQLVRMERELNEAKCKIAENGL